MKAKELKDMLNRAKKAMCQKKVAPITEKVIILDGAMHTVALQSLNMEVYCLKDPIFDGINGGVDFKDLLKIATKLKNSDISIDQNLDKLNIRSSKGVFKLTICEGDVNNMLDVPSVYETMCTITQETADIIQKAFPFVGDDPLRPIMSHVLLDAEGYVVASDAHKMLFEKCQSFPEDIYVSTKLIDKEFSLSKSHCGKWLQFQSGPETIFQHVGDGTYPAWRNVIPKNLNIVLNTDRKELIEKLDFCLLSCNPASQMAVLDLDTKNSEIHTSDIDFGKEFSADIENANAEIKIGVKIPYLSGIAKSISSDTVKIEMMDPTRAMIINEHILLMPMMVSE